MWTFKFLRQKASEPLNQMTSNFVGYLIYSGIEKSTSKLDLARDRQIRQKT